MILDIGKDLAKLADLTPADVSRAIVKLDRLHASGMAAMATINYDPPPMPDVFGSRTDRAARRARRFGRVLR